jgi:hypothetical protein
MESSPVLVNCVFTGNTATDDGGTTGIRGKGGALCNYYYVNATVTNCTFVDNHAVNADGVTANGGAIADLGEEAQSTVTNSILWDNTPNPIHDDWGSLAVTYSCVEGGIDASDTANHIIQMSPVLWLPANGDVRLRAESPCIDAGQSITAPATDLLGVPRSGFPDLGAYEYDGQPFVIISEVVVGMQDMGLQDAQGDYSDWIEVYNGSDTPVNLQGWSLTNDPAVPDKWVFLDNLWVNPGEYKVVVFASGKNLTTGELHTNFTLQDGGGYLALYDNRSPRRLATELDPVPVVTPGWAYAYYPNVPDEPAKDTSGSSGGAGLAPTGTQTPNTMSMLPPKTWLLKFTASVNLITFPDYSFAPNVRLNEPEIGFDDLEVARWCAHVTTILQNKDPNVADTACDVTYIRGAKTSALTWPLGYPDYTRVTSEASRNQMMTIAAVNNGADVAVLKEYYDPITSGNTLFFQIGDKSYRLCVLYVEHPYTAPAFTPSMLAHELGHYSGLLQPLNGHSTVRDNIMCSKELVPDFTWQEQRDVRTVTPCQCNWLKGQWNFTDWYPEPPKNDPWPAGCP